MRNALILLCLIPLILPGLQAQNVNRQVFPSMEARNQRKTITVPDIEGYITLKCDLHLHTVFSDGMVSPETRIQEAWNDGLDVIAITDHDGDHPYEHYPLNGGKTMSELATQAAQRGITVISGVEVTRKMPPGHFNALFVKDASIPEVYETGRDAFFTAITKLKGQGAVIVWNHPGWAAQQKDTVKWFPEHQEMLEKGLLNGIEIFNYNEWYPIALHWALTKDLAPFANSDAHAPICQTYDCTADFIRPMTLVFVRDKTEEGIRDAMLNGRTIAWFNGILAGKAELLTQLLKRSVTTGLLYSGVTKSRYLVANLSDFPVTMKGNSKEWDGFLELKPRNTATITVPSGTTMVTGSVTNWIPGMNQTLGFTLELK